ncbi:MAG: hypothetical protein WAM60_12475 [Candidatus Promineifilaceae bacterium]
MQKITRLLILTCLLLTLSITKPTHASPNTPPPTCDIEPGTGYIQTISGMVDGDPLQIRVSDRFGGAVDSLTWRGKEFINTWDHGRQISYAWSLNNYGECLNPTEPGSAADYQSPTSTSELLSVCKSADNTLTTTTQLAYWLAPGESGFCESGAATAVNDDLLSDQQLQKTIQIGYEGLDNVILFDAQITNPTDYDFMQAEIPTGYLTRDFTSHYFFNPQTGQLTSPETEPLTEPWSYNSYGPYPPIIATPDGQYAMGAYYPGPKRVTYYGIYSYDSPFPDDQTNKWHIVIQEDPYPAGTYEYRSFAIVGTLETVQEAMTALYAIHPVDFNLPFGYIDLASCREIAGWAWDADQPDEPVEVAVYDVGEDGTETLITTTEANIFREDLVEALGDNGQHGFSIDTPIALRDGESHTIRVDGLNPNTELPDGTLMPASQQLTCAAVEQPTGPPPPTETAETTASPTSGAAAVPTAEIISPISPPAPESDSSQPFCGLALVMIGAAVLFVRQGKNSRERTR